MKPRIEVTFRVKKQGDCKYYYCSECGKYINKSFKYCPGCGVKIDWEEVQK